MKRAYGEGSWGTKLINGKTYYRFSKIYDGKRKEFYGETKKEVQQKVDQYEKIGKKIVIDRQKYTFYHYCYEWLHTWRKQNIAEKTKQYYEMIIENYIKDTNLGNMQLKFLNSNIDNTIDVIENHLSSYTERLSKSTIDGIYTVINQVCKYAYKKSDISENWMSKIEKITDTKKKKKKIETFDYEQIMKLWQEAERKNTDAFKINGCVGSDVYGINAYALLFIAFTGLRWGELSALLWKKVDYKAKILTVDEQYILKDMGKNVSPRYVFYLQKKLKWKKEDDYRLIPLCEQAIEILNIVKEKFHNNKADSDKLIFSKSGTPLREDNANRTLKSMCLRQGLPVTTPHALRHSFASILLNQDAQNLYTVSSLLGHSSADFTYKTYIDIFEKEKAKTIDVFSNLKKGDSQ
jgi:integrase